MSEVEWMSVDGKSLLYCAELLDKNPTAQRDLEKDTRGNTRLKTVVKD